MTNIPDLFNRVIDIKQKLDASDIPLVDRFLIWKGEREFYIDKNGIACEILENGDSTSDFEVPDELKGILIKERGL